MMNILAFYQITGETTFVHEWFFQFFYGKALLVKLALRQGRRQPFLLGIHIFKVENSLIGGETMSQRKLHFGLVFWSTGYHPAGWRLPEARTDGAFDPQFLQDIARTVEDAKFDFFFLGDVLATGDYLEHYTPSRMFRLEPFTMVANIAAATKKIGLVVTANTSYYEPYHLARLTASADHLSRGRLAWNVVTGKDEKEALNFNREEQWGTEKRFDYADEFINLVKQLWDSWEDEAPIRDKESGQFVNWSKVHAVNHVGEFFSVKGPLSVARPPQGQIPLLSASTSDRGREHAAQYSDVIFAAQPNFNEAKAYYADVKSRLPKYGRNADELFILPGMCPVVGRTEAEATAKFRELGNLVVKDYDIKRISDRIGIDLSNYSLDDPLPDLSLSEFQIEDVQNIVQLAEQATGKENLTIRELGHYLIESSHLLFVGDPEQVADQIEKWFVEHAADGFNIFPPYMPGGLDLFVELVVPILQQRGLFREEYEGSKFRDHFGLRRPENQFAKQEISPGV